MSQRHAHKPCWDCMNRENAVVRLKNELIKKSSISNLRALLKQHLIDSLLGVQNGTLIGLCDQDCGKAFFLYDSIVFNGALSDALENKAITFRVSRRMFRSAGLTKRKFVEGNNGPKNSDVTETYEIVISAILVLGADRDERALPIVAGIPCRSRLEIFQRVMEHEIVHVAEWLAWGSSNCNGERFKAIARNCFSHSDSSHELLFSSPGKLK